MERLNYQRERLFYLGSEISAGRIHLNDARTQVLDRCGNPRTVSRTALLNAFERFGVPLTMHPGRPVTKPPPGLDDLILKQFGAMPVGYTRMCEYLARAEFTELFECKITSAMVHQIHDYYSLWSYRVIEDEPEPPRCRHEEHQVNLIWHTDLHLYSSSHRWMIAFLDDASRRVMGWSFPTDKKATSTRDVLRKTMEANHVKPYAIWREVV
jgi:hypothetical protein